jgi:hypothetical protein
VENGREDYLPKATNQLRRPSCPFFPFGLAAPTGSGQAEFLWSASR